MQPPDAVNGVASSKQGMALEGASANTVNPNNEHSECCGSGRRRGGVSARDFLATDLSHSKGLSQSRQASTSMTCDGSSRRVSQERAKEKGSRAYPHITVDSMCHLNSCLSQSPCSTMLTCHISSTHSSDVQHEQSEWPAKRHGQ